MLEPIKNPILPPPLSSGSSESISIPLPSGSIDSVIQSDPSAAELIPQRPSLPKPGSFNKSSESSLIPLSDRYMLNTLIETQGIGNTLLDTLSLRLGNVKQQIQTLATENLAKLKEAAERAKASDFWSILKKIATALLSAASIVLGIALVAGGGTALIGGAMIASGILSLANFAMTESQSWDWVAKQLSNDNEEWRKKLLLLLPLGFGVLAGGIGLVGSIHSLATGAIPFAEKAIYIAQTALSLFDAGTTFGKGQADARLLWAKADLSWIESQLTGARHNFDGTMRQIESSMSDFKAIKTKTRQAVKTITRSNIDLVRQI